MKQEIMLKKIKFILWDISSLKKALIEDKVSDRQLLLYWIITVSKYFISLVRGATSPSIEELTNLIIEWLGLPIVCFLIHKRFKMKHFIKKYLTISCVSMIRIGVFLPFILILASSFLADCAEAEITYLVIGLICIGYVFWQYFDLGRQIRNAKAS